MLLALSRGNHPMTLDFNENDCARESHPGVWVFKGKYAVLLVIGAALFLMLFRICASSGIDFLPNVAISLIPTGLMAAWVAFFVNGKLPSYTQDLLIFGRFLFRSWLYRQGIIHRPPGFAISSPPPLHPDEFNEEAR